jgi:hypothetical protein
MSGRRMRWDLVAKLHGRQTMGLQHETDLRSRDRAAKWIAAVERNQMQRRQHQRKRRSLGVTRASSM